MSQTKHNKLQDYYIDENGLFVFTEKYHLEKGYCCGHGCIHCPYDFASVPEPKRTVLLNEKQTG
ncbi:MAG: DUF5522 domain-containing protein [Bacteroidota bacterium]